MRLLLCAALVSVVTLYAQPAPIPRERQVALPYFATGKGDGWVYEYAHGHGGEDFFITDVQETDGTKIVSVGMEWDVGAIKWDGGNVTTLMRVLVSEKGLYRLPGWGGDRTQPLCLLKLPAKVGDTWVAPTLDEKRKSDGHFTVAAIEKVEVPAGTFTAIRVDCSYSVEGKPRTTSQWYAREVGLVKEIRGSLTVVLKSFTKGERR